MAGRIPEQFIDDLLSRVDIVEVIDDRVPLKKAGAEFTACCPFHNEKTPSFTVSPAKQFYHCFGCGAHGTAIGFLMDYDHMDFVEAVENLAARAGVAVPREGGTAAGPPLDRHKHLYQCLADADQYYRRQLREHPAAPRAVSYLKQRGLTGETAEAFGIGFAPPGWDNLLGALGNNAERLRDLAETGMIIERDNKRYDRFRDRIMFPIRDRRGRVIAFGGRVLPDSPAPETGSQPKYLNSPETPVFHKGRELYGLFEARQALRHLQRLLVVEGYMDVVSLAQFGIRYAVATLGTATTPDHLETLFRTAPEVVFCFDGDRAGRQAAWRALENALPVIREGRQISFMFLPEGEDPDTLVRREGAEAFEKRLRDALPLSDFLLQSLASQVDMQSVDGRARLVELSRPLLERIIPGVYLDLLLARLAERIHLPVEQLRQHLGSKQPLEKTPPRPIARQQTGRQPLSLVARTIALLLHEPGLAERTGESAWLAELEQPGIPLLVKLLETVHRNPHLTSAGLVERFRDTEDARHLAKLLSRKDIPEDSPAREAEFMAAWQRLQRDRLEKRCEELESRRNLTDEEKNELKQLHRDLATR